MARATVVFGGSFDPPHLAHVMMVAWALSCQDVDRVLVVPCFRHRFGKESAPFEHRVRMCRLAFKPFGRRCAVSRIEEELGGVSVTLRTLKALRRRLPGASFRLLVGSDILAEKGQWHRFDAVEALAPLLVVGRSGASPQDPGTALPDISSSTVRQLVAEGKPFQHLVPADVAVYVVLHRLYR
jgi:nicotinate-nucleotide adenylyltransferase